jgi:hypothetical protein
MDESTTISHVLNCSYGFVVESHTSRTAISTAGETDSIQ